MTLHDASILSFHYNTIHAHTYLLKRLSGTFGGHRLQMQNAERKLKVLHTQAQTLFSLEKKGKRRHHPLFPKNASMIQKWWMALRCSSPKWDHKITIYLDISQTRKTRHVHCCSPKIHGVHGQVSESSHRPCSGPQSSPSASPGAPSAVPPVPGSTSFGCLRLRYHTSMDKNTIIHLRSGQSLVVRHWRYSTWNTTGYLKTSSILSRLFLGDVNSKTTTFLTYDRMAMDQSHGSMVFSCSWGSSSPHDQK